MRMLRGVLRVLLALFPWLRRCEPLALVDEIWTNLRKETDFCREARNIMRFVEAFRGSATVHVPAAIDGLYTETVLVQELSGGRLSSAISSRSLCSGGYGHEQSVDNGKKLGEFDYLSLDVLNDQSLTANCARDAAEAIWHDCVVSVHNRSRPVICAPSDGRGRPRPGRSARWRIGSAAPA